MTCAGRGWRTNRLMTLTDIEQRTAPAAKYATPADLVYRTKQAVIPVTTVWVYIELRCRSL